MATPSAGPAGDPQVSLSSARGRWIVAVTVLGSGIVFLDSSVVNVALPAVGRDFAKNVLRQTVGRIGEAKDIAFAVCMIASPLNDFMTGTTFRVDGGKIREVKLSPRIQNPFEGR